MNRVNLPDGKVRFNFDSDDITVALAEYIEKRFHLGFDDGKARALLRARPALIDGMVKMKFEASVFVPSDEHEQVFKKDVQPIDAVRFLERGMPSNR